MPSAPHTLPNDPALLRDLLQASQAAVGAHEATIAARDTEIAQQGGIVGQHPESIHCRAIDIARTLAEIAPPGSVPGMLFDPGRAEMEQSPMREIKLPVRDGLFGG